MNNTCSGKTAFQRRIRSVVAILLAFSLTMVVVSAAHAQDDEYAIGEGDLVRITVYDNPDLTTETRVSGGKIALPLIGEVAMNDLTVPEVERKIATLLSQGYILNPHVTVLILEFKKTVYVNGEVRTPGAYKLTKGLTVLKAITLAGGFTDKASEGRTKIVRKTEKGEIKIKTRMDDLVMPDDVIFVPESWF